MLRMSMILLAGLTNVVIACGVHQSTDFQFSTAPGSLDVFAQVIEARQQALLGNDHKADDPRLVTIARALNQAHADQQAFTIFTAIKGHYSEVKITPNVVIQARETVPNTQELLLITELDILDAMATGHLSWSEVKQLGLAKINGSEQATASLDRWFSNIFKE